MAPTTYSPILIDISNRSFQQLVQNTTTNSSLDGDYDSKGALMYVVAVVLVYGLSIAFMIALFVRRKSPPFEESHESTNYFKEMIRIRKKAQLDEHHCKIDKTRQNILKALPQLMVSSAMTPEQVEMLLTAKQRAVERMAAEKQRKTSSHSRISFTNSLTRTGSSQGMFTEGVQLDASYPSAHLPLIPSMDEPDSLPGSEKDYLAFVANPDNIDHLESSVRLAFPNKLRHKHKQSDHISVEIPELDAPIRKYSLSRQRKSHDFESLRNGKDVFLSDLAEETDRRRRNSAGDHPRVNGTTYTFDEEHGDTNSRNGGYIQAHKLLVTDIDEIPEAAPETPSSGGGRLEQEFSELASEAGVVNEHHFVDNDFENEGPWTRQPNFADSYFRTTIGKYEGVVYNEDEHYQDYQNGNGYVDEVFDQEGWGWDYTTTPYYDGPPTATYQDTPPSTLPLERYFNSYDVDSYNNQTAHQNDDRDYQGHAYTDAPSHPDIYDVTGFRLAEGEKEQSEQAIRVIENKSVDEDRQQNASPSSTRSSSGFYEVLV